MLRTTTYGSAVIEYSLRFSTRRSLAISVLPDGKVAVTAPDGVDPDDVDRRVKRRARWILRQQRRFAEFRPRTPPRRFVGGETHRYLGRQYRLKIERSYRDRVSLRSGRLVVERAVPYGNSSTQALLRDWLRERAYAVLTEQYRAAEPVALRIGIELPPLLIRPLEKRWGSHTKAGRIILNQALIGVRRDCIQYVIVHELCHVKEPKHSTAFFRLLRRLLPDWQRRKELLERSTV